jgi:hypothetical protein
MIRLLTYLIGRRDYEPCKSCEVLKQQLQISNDEKDRLLNQLLDITKPRVYEAVSPKDVDPIKPKIMPLHTRLRLLEQASREAAMAQARMKKDNEELEKEVTEDAG